MPDEICLRACAKINLTLDVVGVLPNGYHTLDGVMQSIGLCDRVVMKKGDRPGIFLSMPGSDIPTDKTNIAVCAASRLLLEAGVPEALEIVIDKRIPASAGLGGGSADGAAVLRGVCHLYGWDESDETVRRVALSVGADLPFCLSGGTMRARGVGEILTVLPPMPECFLTVARLGGGVSTPEAYGWIDSETTVGKGEESPRTSTLLQALEKGEIAEVAKALYNRFEAVVLPRRPDAAFARETMLKSGALGALMSGSGTSVFGIFTNESDAGKASAALQAAGGISFVCKPVSSAYCNMAVASTDASFSR